MRLKGRQARFLVAMLGGWLGLRAIVLWNGGPILPPGNRGGPAPIAAGGGLPWPHTSVEDLFRTAPVAGLPPAVARAAVSPYLAEWLAPLPVGSGPVPSAMPLARNPHLMLAALAGGAVPSAPVYLRRAVFASSSFPQDAPSPPPFPTRRAPEPDARRIEGQAYLFVRDGSGRALAAGSALGGSQIAARAAVALDPDRHFAAAARVYAPLHGRGAETAVGIDWHPDPALPLRISVERRQRLDRDGRSAWSAYAAGGFYREVPGVIRVDGYAQAGVVGVHARDAFVDGAVRAEHPVAVGPLAGGIGAGIWGAAQPGASRLDFGPRASLRLPIADHGLSLAIEGRFRVGGNARPGSGVALTIAADL